MVTGFEKESEIATASIHNVDSKDITYRFQEYFAKVKDPRVERTRLHALTDIITISILAVIAGAAGWEDIEEYGLNKQEWLATFLGSIPVFNQATARRLFK